MKKLKYVEYISIIMNTPKLLEASLACVLTSKKQDPRTVKSVSVISYEYGQGHLSNVFHNFPPLLSVA